MAALSVVIIALNEERNIGRCLESVKSVADEILVVDSLSVDGTKSIALSHGAKVIEQPFLGYIEQKNFALDQASHDYVLSLDADEALDEKLIQSILHLKQEGFHHDGYTMNRCSNYSGKWIRHGTWYPDRKLRLMNRKKARWGGTNPHDKIMMDKQSTIKHLQGDILHFSYYSLDEQVAQMNRFTSIQAKSMLEAGKKASFLNLIINPLVAFFAGYFFKAGFLDGVDGFIIARSVSYQTFLKYAKLMHLRNSGNKAGRESLQ
jgi:glycosyltransferase involved in cell wall biosynthesis